MNATANILVPLDGSELAEQAVAVAVELAKPAGGKLTLFVAADREAAAELHGFADAAEMTRAMAADAYLDQVEGRVKDLSVETARTSSDATNAAVEILDRAAEEDISMIVMSSHGRSGIGRWLLGSVAEKVSRSSTVPVVIVPAPGRSRS
jgi:nucleotide-binding universal stress UspA family protein